MAGAAGSRAAAAPEGDTPLAEGTQIVGDGAKQAAMVAATESVEEVLSYDSKSLDADVAKAMALGESWCGAAVDVADFVGVVVGAGVGGGIVSGGRLMRGRLVHLKPHGGHPSRAGTVAA